MEQLEGLLCAILVYPVLYMIDCVIVRLQEWRYSRILSEDMTLYIQNRHKKFGEHNIPIDSLCRTWLKEHKRNLAYFHKEDKDWYYTARRIVENIIAEEEEYYNMKDMIQHLSDKVRDLENKLYWYQNLSTEELLKEKTMHFIDKELERRGTKDL